MSEMIERVAKAIYESRWTGGNWEILAEQRNGETERAKWLAMARAAIEAMRDLLRA